MAYLIRRMGFYLVALWASVTLNFFIPHLAPGNPAILLLGRYQGRIDPSALHSLEIQFGITNEPLWLQYIQYITNLLHGDLGISITYLPVPVVTIISQELPWTLVLVSISLILSFVIGTLLGVFVAWKRGSALESFLPPILTFISAVPQFFLGLVIVYVFAFNMGLFPVSGGFDTNAFDAPQWSWDFMLDAVYHALLPAITFIAVSLSGWMLGMRNAMVTTLNEDYVVMARAKGLSDARVMFAYAARNAIIPNVTGFAIALGSVVTGQLLIEIVFSYPGIGFALLQAVQNSDYALMEGIFLLLTLVILGANFLVDLLYSVLDPRIRIARS